MSDFLVNLPNPRALVLVACIYLTCASLARGDESSKDRAAAAKEAAVNRRFQDDMGPLLKKLCHECHGPKKQEGELSLHKFGDLAAVRAARKQWETVLEMVESQSMPPEDKPQPSVAERKRMVEWIESALYEVDCHLAPDPGRVTIRRLNRAEYDNTVRDLLGIDFQPAVDFPSDDVGYGFDNIGDVLSLPPLLLEKYLNAAERVAAAAVIVPQGKKIPKRHFEGDQIRGERGARLSQRGTFGIAPEGEVYVEVDLPRAGEYLFRIEAGATPLGPDLARLLMRIDGKTVKESDVEAPRESMEPFELRLTLPSGKKRFAAAFENGFEDPKIDDPRRRFRTLHIGSIDVIGPYDPSPEDLPESHKRLLKRRPDDETSVREAAKDNLRSLVDRAFRRPTQDDELDRFAGIVELAWQQNVSFEQAMQTGVTAVLVSPHFLFRVELDDKPGDAAAKRELNDYELASRLSYFLWSSMPDDELFALAKAGKLQDDEVLQAQVRRMLRDRKAWSLVENFGGQWLNLRMLDETEPDPKLFPGVNALLREDMRRETLLYFQEIMREDRSILEFLDGKYTYLNERLAKHYEIPGVEGNEFQRVSLAAPGRAGVLTQASILTLTSNPGRTSPVKRGKWILENILGTPPPEPPPDVPELEATQKSAPNASLRQQLELHRKDPNCAVCHRTMDQLGFGFENFDAVGRWREKDGQLPIDSSGALPGGGKFSGPEQLVQLLKRRKAEFSRALAEKMLTYALGRGLEFYDRCATDKIKAALDKDDRFSTLAWEIVRSEPFRLRRGEGTKP